MIVASTTYSEEYVPPWLETIAGSPKFFLRGGTIIERGQMEAELAGRYNAGKVQIHELIEASRNGLMALLDGDPELDHLLELIDVEVQGETETLSEVDQQKLRDMQAILAEHWGPYRSLREQAERRRELAPVVALKRFCTRIEGDGVEFKLGKDGLVSDDTLMQIDGTAMLWAGGRAFSLQYGGGQEKNSSPASQSDESPQPLHSDEPSKGAGRSAKAKPKRAGRKTPA